MGPTLIARRPAASNWLFICRYSKEDVQHLVAGMLIHMDDAEETIRNAVCEVHSVGHGRPHHCYLISLVARNQTFKGNDGTWVRTTGTIQFACASCKACTQICNRAALGP